MKADEAIRRIDLIVDRTINDWGNVMLEVAETANTLLKQRVIEKGQNAEGQQFDPYSMHPMLVNCTTKNMSKAVCEQLAGTKEKRRDLKWVTLKRDVIDATGSRKGGARLFELAGGYKEFRELHGRQTGFVDFAFSGRMWASVQVVSGEDEHRIGRARISTLSEEEMKKLEGNTKLKGTILDLNQVEIDRLAKIMSGRLTQMWRDQGLL